MHIEKPEGKEYGEVSACEQAAAAVWCVVCGVMSECLYVCLSEEGTGVNTNRDKCNESVTPKESAL